MRSILLVAAPAPAADPVFGAIGRHRAAYDFFQVAPDNWAADPDENPAVQAQDAYSAASLALVSTPCASRAGALALLFHLRWWVADEAEFKADHQPAYAIAEARVADLHLALGVVR